MNIWHVRIHQKDRTKDSFYNEVKMFYDHKVFQRVLCGYEPGEEKPHIHCYVETVYTKQKLQDLCSKVFGKNNTNFSVSPPRKTTMINYCVKDHDIFYYKGFTSEEVEKIVDSSFNTKTMNLTQAIINYVSLRKPQSTKDILRDILGYYKLTKKTFPSKSYMFQLVTTYIGSHQSIDTALSYYYDNYSYGSFS